MKILYTAFMLISISGGSSNTMSEAFVSSATFMNDVRAKGVENFRTSHLGYGMLKAENVISCGYMQRQMLGYTALHKSGSTRRRQRARLVMATRKNSNLSEEEMVTMEIAKIETNRKLEEFLEAKEAVQEEQRRLEANENRAKVIERIETEKAQAAEARTYIPQRLEEIEREEALLKTRMEDFNEKLKDTDLTQL